MKSDKVTNDTRNEQEYRMKEHHYETSLTELKNQIEIKTKEFDNI